MAYINIFDPDRGVYEYELSKDRTVIGRKRALCDCVISDNTVSREHLEIIKDGEKYLVKDMNSSSGIIINGHPEQEFRLVDGMNIQLGKIILEFREGELEKKYKIKGTSLTSAEISKLYLPLPKSLGVLGRFIAVDAAKIFRTGDTVTFGKDGVKLTVPELMLGEYNVLELKLTWPAGQSRSFFTEVIDYSLKKKCVYLKFHKISKIAYEKIIADNECYDWILLQVADIEN